MRARNIVTNIPKTFFHPFGEQQDILNAKDTVTLVVITEVGGRLPHQILLRRHRDSGLNSMNHYEAEK
jgi:hypothetical protein